MQTHVDESQNYDVALKKLDQKKKKIHSFHLHEIPENKKIICVTQNQWLPRVAGEEQNSLQK